MLNENTKTTPIKTRRTKTVAALVAVVAAVALPQIFHLIGAWTGTGTSLGEIFLPMHLAIFMVGLLAGAGAGALAGAASPLVSYLLTGMPSATVLPFMSIELAGYGLFTGLFATSRMSVFIKLFFAQIMGRAARAVAVLVAYYAFGANISVASIWTSVYNGLFGIALQWTLIPILMFIIGKRINKND